MVPTSLSGDGVRLMIDVCALFRVILEDRKTDLGRKIVFLGLFAHFPGPDTDMLLSITLSGEKKGGAGRFHSSGASGRPNLT